MYDYVDGKLDWLAAGLPTVGTNASTPRAADVARRDVPTCREDERIGTVRERMQGWDTCVVTAEDAIVAGLLRSDELDAEADARVEDVMLHGPSTFRPYVPIEEVAAAMREEDLVSSPITSSDGRLIGLLRLDDAQRVAHERHRRSAPADARSD